MPRLARLWRLLAAFRASLWAFDLPLGRLDRQIVVQADFIVGFSVAFFVGAVKYAQSP